MKFKKGDEFIGSELVFTEAVVFIDQYGHNSVEGKNIKIEEVDELDTNLPYGCTINGEENANGYNRLFWFSEEDLENSEKV